MIIFVIRCLTECKRQNIRKEDFFVLSVCLIQGADEIGLVIFFNLKSN